MKHTPEEIKNRLSNIGEAIGNIALDYIATLEQENAELKEINTNTLSQLNLDNGELIIELTKAKEIINDCVCELQNILFYKMRNKERIASTLDKAEQFLSEVEK